MAKINCAEPFTKTSWVLVVEGLLSENKPTKVEILKLLLHFTYYSLSFGLMILSIVNAMKANDVLSINRVVCMIIAEVTVFAKSLSALVNGKCLLSVLRDLQSDTFNSHTVEQNRYIGTVNRIANFILRYYIGLVAVFLSVTCLLPFFFDVGMMIPPPFDITNFAFLYKSGNFLIVSYLSVNSVSCDVLYTAIMGVCIAQFTILQEKLRNSLNEARAIDESRNFEGPYLEEERALIECITLHEMLNRYVDKLTVILSFPLLVQYSGGCFIILNAILQATIMSDKDTANIARLTAYSIATLSQLAIYHWLGNEITHKGDKIIESCYMSKWYELNIKTQKSLILLMEGAKRPFIVKLYTLVHVSLDSLGTIFRWSYSLYALIRARYD